MAADLPSVPPSATGATGPEPTSGPILFPIFLALGDRRVLVVGAGPVGLSKAQALHLAGARLRVVAPEVHPGFEALPGVEVHERPFAEADLDGAFLVVAAAPPEVNRAVHQAAEARGLFCNAADDPVSASAYLGGVVRKGGVTVAISTEGSAPALAGLLREGLEAVLPEELGQWIEVARQARRDWKAAGVPMERRRPLLLRAINALYDGGR